MLADVIAAARWFVATPAGLVGGLVRFVTRRPDVPADSSAYSYAGAVSVLLWALSVVSVVEIVVLHLVIPWPGVRLVADVLGAGGVVFVLGLTACHYAYPHLVGADGLRVRNALRGDVIGLTWDQVRSVTTRERSREGSRGVQVDEAEGILHVVVGSRTNVELRLADPLVVMVRGRQHAIAEVRLFADAPRELMTRLHRGVDHTGA